MFRSVSASCIVLLINAFFPVGDTRIANKPYDQWLIGPHRVEVDHGVRTISAYGLRDASRRDMKSERDLTLSCNVEHPRCHALAVWQIYAMLGADGPYKCDNYTLIRVIDEKSDPIKVDVDDQMSACLDGVK